MSAHVMNAGASQQDRKKTPTPNSVATPASDATATMTAATATSMVNHVPSDMSADPFETSNHSRSSLRSFGSTNSNGRPASSASTADMSSHGAALTSADSASVSSGGSARERRNPKSLGHSSSVVGLDSMIENRRESNFLSNVVHMEVPFGKPIEEVYDGVHTGPVLGSGISGVVRLVTHKATGVKYAVKCLDLGLVDTDLGMQQLREEIFIMCQLDHPNIVRLEEVYESHSEIYLVQELCLGGELFDRLDEQPDYHYTEAECARLVKQMLCAVRYMHLKGIIHRDLKLENFLFSSTAPDSELKLIDFGLSKHFRYGDVQDEAVGTPYTVAPEVIRGKYDERCDIWAIGVITFLLLSGDPPFGGCGGPEPLMTVRSNILRGDFAFEPEDIWSLVSERAREFIRALLVTDPKRRPTAQQAQKHQWLKEWANRTKTKDDHVLNPNVVKALVNFKEYSDMKKLLCEVLSFTLLPEQIKDLRKEFEKMDTDGSGEISLNALKQVLASNAGAGSLGALTEEEVEDIFNAMRVKKTETRIHWHEFIAAGLSQCKVDDRNLRLAFDRLDSDHKGYVTIEDIMDLLGSDSFHSEEVMRKMWGDSMKAVNCNMSRVTYDNFLLLMKGQTADGVDKDCRLHRRGDSKRLVLVPEDAALGGTPSEETKTDPTGLKVTPGASILAGHSKVANTEGPIGLMPLSPIDSMSDNTSTDDVGAPLSMDEGFEEAAETRTGNIVESVFRRSSSFTPPSTPKRSAADYVSPLSGKSDPLQLSGGSNLAMPELSLPSSSSPVYVKKRSRSMGNDSEDVATISGAAPADGDESGHAHLHKLHPANVRDARRAVLLVEHEPVSPLDLDKSKSALQVNRQLYRAHRQMRLAVMDASKRFEEQQARLAREALMAQKEAEGKKNVMTAGLVMRRGENKQVSSEAVSTLLEQRRTEQQKLVEVANKRGGRGRRTRKKTISDMSAMMGSLSQDELNIVVQEAKKEDLPLDTVVTKQSSVSNVMAPVIEATEPEVRGATVPGNFRPVQDPFSSAGKYGVGR